MTYSSVDPAVIGERIKDRRVERGLSVNGLAQASGVSRSMISEVERGGRTPTIVTLDRLAGALGTTSARLLAVEASGEIARQRHSEQTVIGEDGWHRRVLNPVLPGLDFEFMRVEIEPHTDAGAYPPHGSGSREYIAVETGELTLVLDGNEQRLGAGDSIYFPGTMHHEFRNETDETCLYYLVMDMGSHGNGDEQ
ncbi:helix-turn-helix domain-containing protein [Brevibacterium epidermidis]|uniref:helix-turn-helix domain-containing protein n=1 Tax=Brevibacterium epidermidis TaxID=1698 RepID=UPI000784737A|nr:XRE family transcriptional regulator [Brevibacterium epidermidis]